MKHLSTTGLFLFISLTAFLFSCKKSDSPAAPVDVAATLQNKNWRTTAITVSPAMGGVTDVFNNVMPSCSRDDLYRFDGASIFTLSESTVSCDPTGPQTQQGTWSYNTTSKTLHFQLGTGGENINLVITAIGNDSFTGTLADNVSGVAYTYTWSFGRQ